MSSNLSSQLFNDVRLRVLGGRKVLVVDDENDLRDIVSAVFKKAGCELLEADNGKAALEIIDREDVDVVITDIRMAGGDGMELLVKIREKHAKRPAVILITGYADVTESEALGQGASAILAKPFRLPTILETVTRAVEGLGPTSPAL